MNNMDLWRLCDELTIVQAALLVAGHDPSSDSHYVEGWQPDRRNDGYEAVKTALSKALLRGDVQGTITHETDTDDRDIPRSINVAESVVDVDSLRRWLKSKGLSTGFFFPEGSELPGYLNPLNPRYAPKLAAAVNAWLAVDDPGSRSPKKALEKWLRENAVRFGLCDEDGNPNGTGIEECAKVANWQPGGGAPKTPGE